MGLQERVKMTEETEQAYRELDAALTRIKNTKPGKVTSGLEALYGNAYGKLVRLGERPKLRGKYRV
jgi:hypothetical protein